MGLLGFTFGFGARDDGMAASIAAGKAQVKSLNQQIDSLGETASNTRLSSIFDGFNAINLSQISTELQRITGGAQQVTTGLESTMTAYNKEARVFVAQAGLTGDAAAKARSQIAGMAYGMNVGAGQIGKAWQAIETQGGIIKNAFKEAGLGLKDFIKTEEATGVSSDVMINNLSALVKGYGFTGKEAGNFLDKFTAITLAGGQAKDAFSSMQSTLTELDTALSATQFYIGQTPEEQKKYVQDTMLGMQSLAGMIYKTLGGNPADAQEAAKKFTTELLQSTDKLTGALSGAAGGEISNLIKSVAGEAGDFDLATQLVGKSPDEAFKMLMDLQVKFQDAAKKSNDTTQLYRFNKMIGEVLPNFGFMSKMSVKSMDDITAAGKNAEGAFKKLGKEAFTTGFTLQELLDRAKDQFDTRLGSIYGGIGTFVSVQKQAYKETGDAISKLSSDETWGPLAKQFVGAARIGLSAFFIPVKLNAEQAQNRINNLTTAVGDGGLKGRLEAIRQLGVAGVFFDTSKAAGNMAGAIKDAEDKSKNLYGKLSMASLVMEKFQPVVMSVAGALVGLGGAMKILVPLVGAVGGVFKTLGTVIASVIGWPATILIGLMSVIVLWQKMPSKFKKVADDMMIKARDFATNLTAALAKIDPEKISGPIKDALKGVATSIKAFFSGEAIPDGEKSTAMQLGEAIGGLFAQAFVIVKDVLVDVLKTMWEDKDIRKYLTIPLAAAVIAPKAASVAGSVGSAVVGGVGQAVIGRLMGGAGSVVGGAAASAGGAAAGGAAAATAGATAAAAAAGAAAQAATAGVVAAEAAGAAAVATTAGAAATTAAAAGASAAAGTATTAATGAVIAAEGATAASAGGGILSGIIATIGTGGTALIAALVVAGIAAAIGMVDWGKADPKLDQYTKKKQQEIADQQVQQNNYNTQQVASSITGSVNEWLSGSGDWLKNLQTGLNTILASIFQFDMTAAVGNYLSGLFGPDGAFMGGMESFSWGTLLVAIGNFLEGVFTTIGAIFVGLVGVIVDFVAAALRGVIGVVAYGLITLARDVLKGVMGLLPDSVREKLGLSDKDLDRAAKNVGSVVASGLALGYTNKLEEKKESVQAGTAEYFTKMMGEGAEKSMPQYQNIADESMNRLIAAGGLSDVKINAMQKQYASDAELIANSVGGYNEELAKSIMHGREVAVITALGQGRNLEEAMDEYSKGIADKLKQMKTDAEATYRDTWNLDYNRSSVGASGEEVRQQWSGDTLVSSDQSDFSSMESGTDYRSLIDPNANQMSLIGDQPIAPVDPSKANRDALASGAEIVGATAKGIKVGAPAVVNAMKDTQKNLVDIMPQPGVPIAANVPFAKLPNMGKEIMHQIAIGMYDGAYMMMDALTQSIEMLSLTLSGQFNTMGRSASSAFADGVIAQQETDIQFINNKLGFLFDNLYSKITIKDINTEGGGKGAEISVDSIGGLREEIKKHGEKTVKLLNIVADNTYYTALNTGKTAGTKDMKNLKAGTGSGIV